MIGQNQKRPEVDIHPGMAPRQLPDENDNGLEEPTPTPVSRQEPRRQPARPDPRTGEVPAGPGDAGLEDRPVLNAGSPGTRQMSNSRLGIVLGIALLLAIVTAIVAAIF